MADKFIEEQIAALLQAINLLGELNANVHFYTDFLSQVDRNALKKIWLATLHRCRELEKEAGFGKDTPHV